MNCYEKAYYLNLGRYGANNMNTEYFKIKIGIFNETQKKLNLIKPMNSFSQINIKRTHSNKKENSGFSNISNMNDSTIKFNSSLYSTNNFNKANNTNLDIKGFTNSFKFSVTQSKVYEPFVISIYELSSNFDNEKEIIFIKKLYFDKNKMMRFFKIGYMNNNELYKEEFILK